MASKRNRSTNWDEEEKQLFRSILKEYSHIIEDKSLRTNTNKAKCKAWIELHQKFNELNSRPRELSQLQIQWKGMKMSARKNMSFVRKETYKTGGGPKPSSPKQEDIDVTDLLNPAELERDYNIYDSDGTSTVNIFSDDMKEPNDIDIGEETPLIVIETCDVDGVETYYSNDVTTLDNNICNEPETQILVTTPKPPKGKFKKVLKPQTKTAQTPMSAAKVHITEKIIEHSRTLKDIEHKRRMEIMEEEHSITMKIQMEKLKSAELERQILEIKKKIIEKEQDTYK